MNEERKVVGQYDKCKFDEKAALRRPGPYEGYVNSHNIRFTVSVTPWYLNQIAFIADCKNISIEDCIITLATQKLEHEW